MTSIIILDVETTGKDRLTDQIVELCVQGGLGVDAGVLVWRIKPSIPIHPEATAVHGITAEDVATCPTFADLAAEISKAIAGADVIVGYNVAFDIDMLQVEFERAKLPRLDLATKQIVDVLRLWHHVEPRTLIAAHEKFLGWPMADAHAASADVAATGRVLSAMLEKFELAAKPWPELAAIANPFTGREKWIGPSHHVQWRDDGFAVFAFGKNNGSRIDQVDSGFLRWVLGKDFPSHVKDICHLALHKHGPELTDELAKRYPRRVVATSEAA
jgi:DNA polymerase III subunit epsilon